MPQPESRQNNLITPIVRYVSGTMNDEQFNVHQHVHQVISSAFKRFGIDQRDAGKYELRLDGAARALRPEQTLTEAGVTNGTVLLLLTRDQTDVDG